MFVCFFTYFRYNGKEKVWRLVNERYLPECMKASIKYDKKINVWGCFCWQSLSYQRNDGRRSLPLYLTKKNGAERKEII